VSTLAPQQTEALAAIRAWLKDPDRKQVFRLFGYAGTGKTTIARQFEPMVGGLVLYAAFTGKATLVLQERGCEATTIHRLIYIPAPSSVKKLEDLELELLELQDEAKTAPDEDAFRLHQQIMSCEEEILQENKRANQPRFEVNPDSVLKEASLLVIDEVSMVGRQMAADLLSYEVPILVLGDPAQLPPVADSGFFTNCDPDYMLTEVHRQSQDSPVLALATTVRRRINLERGQYGASSVLSRGTLDIAQVVEYDQILVGRNRTRKGINREVREHLGFTSHLPEEGDRLVCLRNDYDMGLLNGSQWTVLSCQIVTEGVIRMDIVGEGGGMPMTVVAHRHYFEDREDTLRPWDIRAFQAFDFAYAMTVHKSQGSSWPNVLVIDESTAFREHRYKHLYTAITRASESVTVVQ